MWEGSGVVSDWQESVGLLTGDDGVGFRVLVLNHFPSTMKVNILKIVPVVIFG
jgi:hypothetical protein